MAEVDETLTVRRKHDRGRLPNQAWVFGGQKGRKQIVLSAPRQRRQECGNAYPLNRKIHKKGQCINR